MATVPKALFLTPGPEASKLLARLAAPVTCDELETEIVACPTTSADLRALFSRVPDAMSGKWFAFVGVFGEPSEIELGARTYREVSRIAKAVPILCQAGYAACSDALPPNDCHRMCAVLVGRNYQGFPDAVRKFRSTILYDPGFADTDKHLDGITSRLRKALGLIRPGIPVDVDRGPLTV